MDRARNVRVVQAIGKKRELKIWSNLLSALIRLLDESAKASSINLDSLSRQLLGMENLLAVDDFLTAAKEEKDQAVHES